MCILVPPFSYSSRCKSVTKAFSSQAHGGVYTVTGSRISKERRRRRGQELQAREVRKAEVTLLFAFFAPLIPPRPPWSLVP